MIKGFFDKLLGFDLVVTFPKYINIQLQDIHNSLSLQSCKFTDSFPFSYGGYVVFLDLMIGLMIASFIIIYWFRPKVDDLCVDNPSNIYWFSYRFNWCVSATWALGTFPSLSGFIANVNLKVGMVAGSSYVFFIYFFMGMSISFVVFILLHYLFPAPSFQMWVTS